MLVTVTLIFLWKKVITVKDEIVFGVYRRYNKLYWLKFAIVFLWLTLNNKVKSIVKKIKSLSLRNGIESTPVDVDKDQPNDVKSKMFQNNYNRVHFTSSNSSGYSLILGVEREGVHCISSTLSITIPKLGNFLLPLATSTHLDTIQDYQSFWNVNGFRVENTSTNVWSIEYKGQLINEKNELVAVGLNLEWNGSPTYQFDHSSDNHPKSLARAAANSIWTKYFFHNFKEMYGNRIERVGKVSGTITLNTGEEHNFDTSICLCAHSFGKTRDLRVHRYATFVLFLKNNSCISLDISNKGLTGSR